jgi:hypothetical protein
MPAQCRRFVLAAESAAAAQLGHDVLDEGVEACRQHVGHQVEPVGHSGVDPLEDRVRDLLRRAGRDPVPGPATQAEQQRAHGEVLASREVDRHSVEGLRAAGRVGLGQQVPWQLAVEVEILAADAELAGEPVQRVLRRDEFGEQLTSLACLGLGRTDDPREPR